MNLTVALQACPLENMDPKKETTLLLGAEACLRYPKVYYYTVKDLFLDNGKPCAMARPVNIDAGAVNTLHFTGDTEKLDLSHCDVILMRQNPPVDQEYLLSTYILDYLPETTHVFNNPKAVRGLNGKFFANEFPDYVVPYRMGSSFAVIETFRETYPDNILKPVGGYGGTGIFRIRPDADARAIYEEFRKTCPGMFIIQKHIPEAAKGDKRIILFDGDPVAALLRVPPAPDMPANITLGATIEKTDITPREQELCRVLGPRLRELGLFFVGIDMLGDWLVEINIISPGTVRPANNLYGMELEKTFWNKVEERLAKNEHCRLEKTL